MIKELSTCLLLCPQALANNYYTDEIYSPLLFNKIITEFKPATRKEIQEQHKKLVLRLLHNIEESIIGMLAHIKSTEDDEMLSNVELLKLANIFDQLLKDARREITSTENYENLVEYENLKNTYTYLYNISTVLSARANNESKQLFKFISSQIHLRLITRIKMKLFSKSDLNRLAGVLSRGLIVDILKHHPDAEPLRIESLQYLKTLTENVGSDKLANELACMLKYPDEFIKYYNTLLSANARMMKRAEESNASDKMKFLLSLQFADTRYKLHILNLDKDNVVKAFSLIRHFRKDPLARTQYVVDNLLN